VAIFCKIIAVDMHPTQTYIEILIPGAKIFKGGR
jgi:hypothetical protein